MSWCSLIGARGAFTVRIITSLVSGRLVDISEDKPDTPELVLLLRRVKVW